MITLATAHVSSTAPAESFFAKWADMPTWPEWNLDTEWVRLDGEFVAGTTGQLRPKGGPKTKFMIEELVPGERFVDVSYLVGARLTFRHLVTQSNGDTVVDVTAELEGPMTRVWKLILGKGIAESMQPDLDRLVALVEAK